MQRDRQHKMNMKENLLYLQPNILITVQWKESLPVHQIIAIVYNTQTGEKSFYFFNPGGPWLIDKGDDPKTTLKISLYGIQKKSSRILVSNKYIISPASKGFQDCVLEGHTEKNSPLNIKKEIKPPLIPITVDQRVNKTTQKSYVVFQRCTPLPRHAEYYIQIVRPINTRVKASPFKEYIQLKTCMNNEIACAWYLESGWQVTYQILNGFLTEEINELAIAGASDVASFITHNTKDDVQRLFDMAEKLRGESFTRKKCTKSIPIPYLYRNKPSNHETMLKAEETGIISKYLKDKNGDQASSINEKIKGLFFSASANKKTKQPQEFSYFGNYRIMIKPELLLPGLNLYFADFYCQGEKKQHYVTLVLTTPDSLEDRYCRDRLVKLDINNNNFLYYQKKIGYRVTKAMLVEVLYTEDVDLTKLRSKKSGFVEQIIPNRNVLGRGQSKPEGIPKYTSCDKCNLH
ncbi:phytanoyl-CoA hydroxylase-interacting protein-like [Patella vulgata]|uniref:phytanoyl-CoA hydroxylase-interacting protein-like n=1 Tax=Patella vulgata TaxID=6465 RepID=UPI00217FFBA6|nr:phytanoyl-CoA hydroxylase-interacting protein-like [Patella vulgata]